MEFKDIAYNKSIFLHLYYKLTARKNTSIINELNPFITIIGVDAGHVNIYDHIVDHIVPMAMKPALQFVLCRLFTRMTDTAKQKSDEGSIIFTCSYKCINTNYEYSNMSMSPEKLLR